MNRKNSIRRRLSKLAAMKLKLIFIVLIVNFVCAKTENSTNSLNVTRKPKVAVTTTTTPAPNFISNTLDNIRKFFFSKFSSVYCLRFGDDFYQ